MKNNNKYYHYGNSIKKSLLASGGPSASHDSGHKNPYYMVNQFEQVNSDGKHYVTGDFGRKGDHYNNLVVNSSSDIKNNNSVNNTEQKRGFFSGKALFNDTPDKNIIESEEPPPSNSSIFSKRKTFTDKS